PAVTPATALEALRTLGIPPTRYRKYLHEFSGGMRQRIMIALTLVLRPKFMVADEPTTALDVLVTARLPVPSAVPARHAGLCDPPASAVRRVGSRRRLLAGQRSPHGRC